jgi:hypothetical protein
MLSEVTPEATGMPKTSFMQIGGGLSIDIATWAKVLNCLKLSGGYTLEGSDNKGRPEIDIGRVTYSSGFLNLGLYYNFWQRFSLLGGYQQIVGNTEVGGDPGYTFKLTQTHWAAGLEYKVNEAQKVVARFGQLGASPDDSRLTDELNKANSFKATQVEAYIVVNF